MTAAVASPTGMPIGKRSSFPSIPSRVSSPRCRATDAVRIVAPNPVSPKRQPAWRATALTVGSWSRVPISATTPNPTGTAATSSRRVAARWRRSRLHESGNGRTVDIAVPAVSMRSCAITVSRKCVPVARPVISPWSFQLRSERDRVKVVGTTPAATTIPTCCPRPMNSDLAMRPPVHRPAAPCAAGLWKCDHPAPTTAPRHAVVEAAWNASTASSRLAKTRSSGTRERRP